MKRFFLALCLFPVLLAGCDLAPRPVDPAPHVEPVSTGLRVLIIEETADRPRLPSGQQAVFSSVPLRQYLKDHCTKRPDGKPDYLIVDKDAELSGDWAKTATNNPPTAYPWLYVTNGRKGYSGPLPTSVEKLLAQLKPYAE